MPSLSLCRAIVISIESETDAIQNIRVKLTATEGRAVNYLALGDRVYPGQEVLVNTTAVDLKLGSGGCHFVLPKSARREPGWGHQMKLRYTPLQLQVNCAEEQNSPWHSRFINGGGLEGIPVLAAELHSMLPPLALAINTLDPSARIAYLVTDGGALPAGFSRNTGTLKTMGILSQVITSGHSFGGDLETINVFSGLQAAARVVRADYVIVAMGPGIAGTGTKYGFSGLEQGFVLQAAHALGGYPIPVPRIGFADHRPRHQGISHHSLTVLESAYSGPAWLPLPLMRQPMRGIIARQAAGLPPRYRSCWRDGTFIQKIAEDYPDLFSSMGRGIQEIPQFFLALGAAARLAVELYRSKPPSSRIAIK